jgi:hypothetical protein
MMDTPSWPDTRLERTLTGKIQLVESDDYIRKFMVNSAQIIEEEIPRLGGSWVGCLFLAALLVPFQRPALRKFRWWIVGNQVVLWVVQSLIRTHLSKDSPLINSENLIVVTAPLAFIFGCGLFLLLLDQFEWQVAAARSLAMGVFCVIACAPLIYAVLPPRTFPMAYPPYYPPQIRVCTEMMEKNELMMSDVPWALAWYGQRQAIWLTLDLKTDFFQLNDNMKPVKALYLTSVTTDAKFNSHFTEGQDAAWNRFYLDAFVRKNIPTGFPLNNAPSGFLPEQLMLTDRRRWR